MLGCIVIHERDGRREVRGEDYAPVPFERGHEDVSSRGPSELAGDCGFATILGTTPCTGVVAPELDQDLDTAADLALARARGWLD